jgi:hypothetical protein
MSRISWHAVPVAALLTLLAVPAAIARDAGAVVVEVGAGGLVLRPAPVAHFERMTVRVAGPGGLVLDAASAGEPVAWAPGPDAPDGHYRYEAVVVTRDPALAHAGQDENDPGGVAGWRTTGSFRVSGGVIQPVPPPRRR